MCDESGGGIRGGRTLLYDEETLKRKLLPALDVNQPSDQVRRSPTESRGDVDCRSYLN